jgi:hypothetical protein
VKEQINICLKWLAEFQTKSDKLDDSRHYEKTVFQFRISQTEAMLQWLNNQITELG